MWETQALIVALSRFHSRPSLREQLEFQVEKRQRESGHRPRVGSRLSRRRVGKLLGAKRAGRTAGRAAGKRERCLWHDDCALSVCSGQRLRQQALLSIFIDRKGGNDFPPYGKSRTTLLEGHYLLRPQQRKRLLSLRSVTPFLGVTSLHYQEVLILY